MLRVSELYKSIQGEGPNVGMPVQFVRFAGCNMRCPQWPCDTPQAIFPEQWREEATKYDEPKDLVADIRPWPLQLCLTGGEPLLQPEKDLKEFCRIMKRNGYLIEMFSNGSFQYPEWVLRNISPIVMDWKLPGSGEHRTVVEVRKVNALNLDSASAVKFTIAETNDMFVAMDTYRVLLNEGLRAQVYVGAVWGKITDQEIVEFMMDHKLPWYHQMQTHKHIWHPEARYT